MPMQRFGVVPAKLQPELLILAERLGIMPEFPQRLRKISRKAVHRVNFFGLHVSDQFQQLWKISMIAEWKGSMALMPKLAICVHSPTGENGSAGLSEIPQHG